VIEHKCDMVNITVPQRECDTIDSMSMDKECKIVEEQVTETVCVTVMDKLVEEKCEEYFPDSECFEARCNNKTRPVFSKQCHQVMDEKCEVILDTEWEDQCSQVESVEYEEECNQVTSQECVTTKEWICEDQDLGLEYGAPKAPVVTESVESLDYDTNIDTYGAPKVETTQANYQNNWRRKKSFGSSKQRAKANKIFAKNRLSRSDDEGTEVDREKRLSEPDFETASEKVGTAFLQIGSTSFNSNYYGQIPGIGQKNVVTTPSTNYKQQSKALESTYKPHHTTTKAPVVKKCYTSPQKKCNPVTKKECKQVPRTVSKNVCIPVKIAKPRQECVMSPRQECDVKESFETYQDCGVIPVDKFPSTRCSNQIREVPREVCQDIAVTRFKEECEDVTKMIPTIACETKMKPIELKEICVDIEIQLPREECRSQEKEVCRYEPRQEIIQRCEPTVKEVCHSTQETVCQQQCKLRISKFPQISINFLRECFDT